MGQGWALGREAHHPDRSVRSGGGSAGRRTNFGKKVGSPLNVVLLVLLVRRQMMNAKAEAALRDVAAAITNSSLTVPLQAAQLLGELGLVGEQEDLEEAMRADIANAAAIADGAAGDPTSNWDSSGALP